MFDLKSLSRLPQFETRSISPENRTGERAGGARTPLEAGTARNAARDLGTGWKVNPYLHLEAGETLTLADIQGSGVIRHIWLTPTGAWRSQILRFYWDDSDVPAVECPLGDFFACGWGEYAQVSSLAVCVNPGSAFNSYWEMPFRRRARVTLENRGAERCTVYYQITYTLEPVEEDRAYFHAQFHRANPLPYKQEFPILDKIQGRGLYAGTYMAWGVHNSGWWGEGEIKFFLDGDEDSPPSAAPARRTTSAAPTTLRTRRRTSTRPSPRPIRAYARSCARTASTARRRALASTAGTSRTPSPSPRTSA